MSNYCFDFGFDWNASPNEDNILPLKFGLVDITTANHTAIPLDNNAYYFDVGDTFEVNVWNLTVNTPQLQSFWGSLSFSGASPIAETSVALASWSYWTGTSTVFGGEDLSAWNACFPQNVINAGTFQFTASISVSTPAPVSTKTFAIDPEMIVQATPPPSGGGDYAEERLAVRR